MSTLFPQSIPHDTLFVFEKQEKKKQKKKWGWAEKNKQNTHNKNHKPKREKSNKLFLTAEIHQYLVQLMFDRPCLYRDAIIHTVPLWKYGKNKKHNPKNAMNFVVLYFLFLFCFVLKINFFRLVFFFFF